MNDGRARTIFCFDFDGTLATIVADRQAARLHPACRQLLRDLVIKPENIVAILSSRSLDDLIARVPVSGVFLGGGSGIEWRVPGGERLGAPPEEARQIETLRHNHLRRLTELVVLSGGEVEDKYWSVAVHTRRLSPAVKEMLALCLDKWCRMNDLQLFRGPEVLEVQFLERLNKEYGVRRLCDYVGYRRGTDRLFYAGDDENDARAMAWVVGEGGTVFAIGTASPVAGAYLLDGPLALAQTVGGAVPVR
ncbi:hypothetical protein GURASL_27170 [Geotalea uraniireducens]|uniref:Trehalose 6-phosphate phosphatase n=1 Tax=Geotalea uraniireducens TaxID=351604 RepID=A0ABM8EMX2_9BACT|nr:trehalose-phosphatase [Geotalea uraniireducens]BDV43794.1 hypothetical protein GURASL_27170 [Geotalea uraniireducens]